MHLSINFKLPILPYKFPASLYLFLTSPYCSDTDLSSEQDVPCLPDAVQCPKYLMHILRHDTWAFKSQLKSYLLFPDDESYAFPTLSGWQYLFSKILIS